MYAKFLYSFLKNSSCIVKFFFFFFFFFFFSGLGSFDMSWRIYHLLFDIQRTVHRDVFV